MYYTHHFAHPETLTRARAWLTELGFPPHQINAHTEGRPRLSLEAQPHQIAAIQLLISVVERSDPDGFPSFWDSAKQARVPHHPLAASAGSAESSRVPIGWHPHDPATTPDPESEFVREALSRNWD